MDGLFVVIAIVVGIFKFTAEQKKKQGGSKQRSVMQPAPGQRLSNIPEPLKKVLMDLESGWNEGLQGPVYQKTPAAVTEEEGIEQEDRDRTGSINYTERSDSSEGECEEHSFHWDGKAKADPAVNRSIPAEEGKGFVLDITEEELLRSIVMSEILGPPRAMKRKIR